MPPQVRQLLPTNLLPDRMQSRNDPLNRSTRPLLERKHFAPQPKKKSIDPKVNGFNGFNDFNSIPRQYDSLGTRMNMYGEVQSPAATTATNNLTFKFSDGLAQHRHYGNYNNHLSDSDSSSFDTPRPVRRNDLTGVKDWAWKPVPPPRVPPQFANGSVACEGNGVNDGPFVFGVSQNAFLPAYNTPQLMNKKNGKFLNANGKGISPNTSQVRIKLLMKSTQHFL